MDLILQVFYSIFSSIILAAALPTEFCLLGIPGLTLIALIPLYLAFSKSKNYFHSFLIGFIQTCVTHLLSSFWLANFKDFAALTLGASAFGTGLIGGGVFLFMHHPYASSKAKNNLNDSSLSKKFTDTPVFRILYFASIYTLYEWMKSVGFLGYPWATLAGAIYRWPYLMQIASVTGTYGIAWLIAFLNGLFAELIITFYNRFKLSDKLNIWSLNIAGRLIIILFAVSLVHGIYQYNKKRTPDRTLNAVMVQQNSNPWEEESDEASILASERMSQEHIDQMKNEGTPAELIVWSEGVLRYRFPQSEKHYKNYPDEKPLYNFVQENNIPLLTGGSFTRDKKRRIYFNAAIMYDAEGNYRGVYGKNHLVPMAEAIPGMEYPFVKDFMERFIGISAGWTPGDQYVLFNIPCSYYKNRELDTVATIDITIPYQEQKLLDAKKPTVKIAAPICYDDAFPDIMRPLFLNGAELFVNLTDDSWSLLKSSEYQHYIISSYRCIEYRTPMVRSTNAGCTVVIDANGATLAMLPLFEQTAMHYTIPIYRRTMTTYARFGNWLPVLLLILCLAYIAYTCFTFVQDDYIPSERKIKKFNRPKKGKKKKK